MEIFRLIYSTEERERYCTTVLYFYSMFFTVCRCWFEETYIERPVYCQVYIIISFDEWNKETMVIYLLRTSAG
jgi:hypothetical protein